MNHSILSSLFLFNNGLATTNYNSSSNYYMLIFNIIIFFLASLFIIFLAYITTRYLSNKFSPTYNSRNIKLIEKLTVGVDKSLVLIELDNNYYLIFISKGSAQLIDKIESLNVNEHDITNDKFNDILSKFTKKK